MRTLILLIAVTLASSAGSEPFSRDVDASWSFTEADGMCLLEQAVRDFGTVRFAGAPGAPLRLEVLGHREVFADGGVSLYRVAPPWHPDHPETQMLGTAEQRAGSMLLVADPLATRVLMSLYDGYETRVQHATWYGGDAGIRIGNEHLRPRYEAFARCLRAATAEGWSGFERTRVEYPTQAADLDQAARRRLRRVAEYVQADPDVARVYVDGHTDDVGSAHDNLALSRQRAEAVADYLASCGVPREHLVVRYHGAQYPVARGDSEAVRAENRRTTVRLERHSESDVATR